MTKTKTQGERPEIPQVMPKPPDPVGPFQRLVHRATGKRTRGQFAYYLMPRWGVPYVTGALNRKVVHRNDMLSMMSWAQAEGDAGMFNMLNCVEPREGSWPMPGNSAGVQHYPSFEVGQNAHARTMNFAADHNQFGFKAIREALRVHAHPSVVLKAVEESAWGTGGLALRVYHDRPDEEILNYRFHLLVQ